MKLKRVDAILYQSLFLALAGIVLTRMMALNSVSSLFFALTFPLTIAIWLRSIRQGFRASDWITVAVVAIAGIHVILNMILSGGRFSFSYYKKLIMFYMTLLYLSACHHTIVGRKITSFIHIFADILSVLFIVMYVVSYNQMHFFSGTVTNYLTFRLTNPNLTAMFLVCIYMLEFSRLLLHCSPWEKKVRIGVLTVLTWFIIDTRSRNGLLVILGFTLVALIYLHRLKIKVKIKRNLPMGFNKGFSVLISMIPFMFAVVYMFMINGPWVESVFGFLSGMGKKLNSRVKVWDPAMLCIGDSPWIGSYYAISNGTGQSQMHNSHLDMAASYGIPVMLLVCILLAFYIWNHGKRYRRSVGFVYMFSFCCALMLGIFEAAMFSGGLGIYILLGMFLLLANSESEENRVS